jgi:hypothetical protein
MQVDYLKNNFDQYTNSTCCIQCNVIKVTNVLKSQVKPTNKPVEPTSNICPVKQAEIEKLKEYKAPLINSAVTGKIKVV